MVNMVNHARCTAKKVNSQFKSHICFNIHQREDEKREEILSI